jgi:ADP-heptose:LPS heptosyltransferase
MSVGTPRRILVVWICRLGDFIVSTPFLSALRQKFPQAEITLLARGYVRGAADMTPSLDRRVYLPSLSSPKDAAGFCRDYLGGKFDLCVDLNPAYSRTAGLMARLSGAKERISFAKFRADWFYTATIPAPKEDEHMLERYRRLADYFGAPFSPKLELAVSAAERAAARELLARYGINGQAFKVAIHPGNFKKFDHRWPEEKFAELAKKIAALPGVELFYISGPGETEQVRAAAEMAGVKKVLPPLSLAQTAALLKEINLLIVSATGTMHLAAAAGTPMLTFQSGYTAKCWQPLQGEGIHLNSGDWNSLRSIAVDKAWHAFTELKKKLGDKNALR